MTPESPKAAHDTGILWLKLDVGDRLRLLTILADAMHRVGSASTVVP